MNHNSYPDSYIRGILNTVKTIAMVGASEKENRPSYFAFKYLLERGYHMIPVNPGHAGQTMLGQRIYARLADIPEPIDMVDIFRGSQYAPAIVQEALALKPRPQVIWMQLGVRNDEAAALAEANGLKVVMNRCPKIEYGRLSSEIAWMGVNTRTLSSKKATMGGIQRMTLNRTSAQGGATEAADKRAARRNRPLPRFRPIELFYYLGRLMHSGPAGYPRGKDHEIPPRHFARVTLPGARAGRRQGGRATGSKRLHDGRPGLLRTIHPRPRARRPLPDVQSQQNHAGVPRSHQTLSLDLPAPSIHRFVLT